MNHPTPLIAQARRSRAFSLVEVVLAIGVTSFALLGMVALLPLGLRTAQQAVDATTEAQIVAYARNQMEMSNFTNLATVWGNPATGTLYFDNQGLPTTQNDPEQVYTATFLVGNVNLSSGGSSTAILTNNANLNNDAPSAQTVQVQIVHRNMSGSAATHTYSIVIPNAGF